MAAPARPSGGLLDLQPEAARPAKSNDAHPPAHQRHRLRHHRLHQHAAKGIADERLAEEFGDEALVDAGGHQAARQPVSSRAVVDIMEKPCSILQLIKVAFQSLRAHELRRRISAFVAGNAEMVKLGVAEIERLMLLVDEVAREHGCTHESAIGMISAIVAGKTKRSRVRLGKLVCGLRRIRMRRNELLGAPLFRDPAWDMLLALFAANREGKDVSVTSLCLASGVPLTTALRHIERLEAHGMVYREGDRMDDRRLWVRPTDKTITGIGTTAALVAAEVSKSTIRVEETGGLITS